MAKKILIIENDKEIRTELSRFFKENGYTVLMAKHTMEAVKAISKKAPDLIITEIFFPVMDAFQFLEYYRTMPKAVLVPVVFISSKIDSTTIRKIISYKIDNYMKKPLRMNDLNRIVKDLLK